MREMKEKTKNYKKNKTLILLYINLRLQLKTYLTIFLL